METNPNRATIADNLLNKQAFETKVKHEEIKHWFQASEALGGASARGFEDDNNTISVSNPVKLDDQLMGSAIKFGQVVKYTVSG
jgi:hypothetical protein